MIHIHFMKMRFGVDISIGTANQFADFNVNQQVEILESTVKKVEELGYDSIWIVDHFVPLRGKPNNNSVYEAWTTLTYLSSLTKKVKLGNIVLCNAYRNPALLAKMTACLDVFSRGRFELGYGAGWADQDYDAYGYPFPKTRVRMEMMEEGIQIIRKMWTEESPTFNGKHYSIKDAFCSPKPIQKPHPPIMIGGMGKKFTLRVVAKYADTSNFVVGNIQNVKILLDVLKQHCEDVSRKYNDIRKSLYLTTVIGKTDKDVEDIIKRNYGSIDYFKSESLGGDENLEETQKDNFNGHLNGLVGTPDKIIQKLEELAKLDVSFIINIFPEKDKIESLTLFRDEVLPAFK